MDISLIVPCFNEEENIFPFYNEVQTTLCDYSTEIIFVNDGSSDHTMEKLRKLFQEASNIKVISFSRNFGKEAAIYAGLKESTGEYTILIDADLQQPLLIALDMIHILDNNDCFDMVAAYQDGRIENKRISLFKTLFYKFINRMADIELHENASDFRCLRRGVVESVLMLQEYHRFSKGLFSWVGYQTCYIPYKVRERASGTSKWSFLSLVKYALEGMISFSIKPLRIATAMGGISSIAAIIYMIFVVIKKLIQGIDVPGYPTLVVLILFLGGVQLMVLGILGEYIAKIHIEVKNRPIYIVKEYLKR